MIYNTIMLLISDWTKSIFFNTGNSFSLFTYVKICEKAPRIRGAKNLRFENSIQLTVISGVLSFRSGID